MQTDNASAIDVFCKALDRRFGAKAIDVAEEQVRSAAGEARETWVKIVERLTKLPPNG